MANRDKVVEASKLHPKPDQIFQYGTAGFRMKANLLDSVVFRVGLLAALRSRKFNGKTVGVMITASHNPPEDNGVKLVDPMGEMLEQSWEAHATSLANAVTDEALFELYEKLITDLKIKISAPARVIYGRDTRTSGPTLVASLKDALTAVDAEYTDFKILTTPQLHYLVRCTNTEGTEYEYGTTTEKGYYAKLANGFKKAMFKHKFNGEMVFVDCANGVGGAKMKEFIRYMPVGFSIIAVNDDVHKPESLNVQCGADFVKTQQRAPPSCKPAPLQRWASIDGDADRIVFFYHDKNGTFHLLDGDRIATLAASFLVDLARTSGLADKLEIGVVQTAYANGGSTKYIAEYLKLPVVCTNTGVKHLHHAAMRFDIGIYFEANGHGTILFSENAVKEIDEYMPKSPAQADALTTLRGISKLMNQTVGDAFSDLLLVEVILAHKKWTLENWLATYSDLPNRLVRVEVKDRNIFKAYDAERKLESPKGVQREIDTLVVKYKLGRAFARASGTEDAVRVYAEAATRAETDDLATKVAHIVKSAH